MHSGASTSANCRFDFCDDVESASDIALWSLNTTSADVARLQLVHALFALHQARAIAYHGLPDHFALHIALRRFRHAFTRGRPRFCHRRG